MSKPPKIVIPGLNRGSGIPGGYVLGRRRGTKQGPAELLNLTQVRAIGIATTTDVTTSTSLVQSIAHSETISLSRSVSSSLSAISGSVSGAVSSVTSLSTAVSSGLSSTNSTDVRQSTSLSQISSSLSGAISSTASLSSAVSTVDNGQSTSLSQISSSLSGAISSTSSLSATLGTAAVKNTGTSGNTIPLLDGASPTWTNGATFGGSVTVSAPGIPLVINSTIGNENKLGFQEAGAAVGFFGCSSINPFIASDAIGNVLFEINVVGNAQLIQLSGGAPAGPRFFFGPATSKIEAWADAAFSTYNPLELAGSSVILRSGATTIGTVTSTAFNLASGIVLQINATQVVGARKTGWAVDTGTSKRTANATYAAGATLTFTNPPTAAEMSALAARLSAVEAALQDYTQTTKAMKDDLHSTAGHGLIGT